MSSGRVEAVGDLSDRCGDRCGEFAGGSWQPNLVTTGMRHPQGLGYLAQRVPAHERVQDRHDDDAHMPRGGRRPVDKQPTSVTRSGRPDPNIGAPLGRGIAA